MSKNTKMLKCFYRVMKNDKKEIQKIIPDMYVESFYKVDENYLLKQKIDNLILDIDGTLLRVDDINVPEILKEKIKKLKEKNIKICLVSNNNADRVVPVAKALNLTENYLYNANKPLPVAFDKALEILETPNKENTAMVGDQMMSDIKGANEYGLYSVLVRPVDNHNNINTGVSRFLQNIMEDHLKKINVFDKEKYYKRRIKK